MWPADSLCAAPTSRSRAHRLKDSTPSRLTPALGLPHRQPVCGQPIGDGLITIRSATVLEVRGESSPLNSRWKKAKRAAGVKRMSFWLALLSPFTFKAKPRSPTSANGNPLACLVNIHFHYFVHSPFVGLLGCAPLTVYGRRDSQNAKRSSVAVRPLHSSGAGQCRVALRLLG